MKKDTDKTVVLISNKSQHPFHILGTSPLPIVMASCVGLLALSIISQLHSDLFIFEENFVTKFLVQSMQSLSISVEQGSASAAYFLIVTLLGVILTLLWFWGDRLIIEAEYQGFHTKQVQAGIKLGMILFLASEAMLFFPFFWSFFHASLSPSIFIGGVWPPYGIEVLNPFLLPLGNTIVLLCSGIAIVSAHRSILAGRNWRIETLNAMFVSIFFGILFSWLQFLEYGLAHFTINDGIYGSTFYMLTGLHGFHVIVGTILLLIAYFRIDRLHFTTEHHLGFELAAWYWHFVDVVWLFVYTFVYCWGWSWSLNTP